MLLRLSKFTGLIYRRKRVLIETTLMAKETFHIKNLIDLLFIFFSDAILMFVHNILLTDPGSFASRIDVCYTFGIIFFILLGMHLSRYFSGQGCISR